MLRFYASRTTYTGGAIEIPLNLSLTNTTIKFTVQFASPDGIHVYILNESVISTISATPSDTYEDKIIGVGYAVTFDVYSGQVRIYHDNGSGSVQDTYVSYTFTTGTPLPVEIDIVNGNVTVYINGTAVISNYTLPSIGLTTFKYLVIGGRVGGYAANADCWIDDIYVLSDDGATTTTTTSTTTPTNTTTTTSANTAATTTTTPLTLTEKIRSWWDGLSTMQKAAVAVGGLILLLILAMSINPSRKVR